jgi:hypothetical protein
MKYLLLVMRRVNFVIENKHTIMRKHLLIIALLIIPLLAVSQETIVLKNGDKIKCRVTGTDSLNIYIDVNRNGHWIHTFINAKEVAQIGNWKKVDYIKPDTIYMPSVTSFRVKTDIGQWICLYPNIGLEYRNKNFAINAAYTLRSTGIAWPNIVFGDDTNFIEQWSMVGNEITMGVKLYFPKINNRYFSFQLNYEILSFPKSQIFFLSEDYYREEQMSRTVYGCSFLYGIENKRGKSFFCEWYFGVGLKYEKTKKIDYSEHDYGVYTYYYPPKLLNYAGIVPTIIMGFNIGIKTN